MVAVYKNAFFQQGFKNEPTWKSIGTKRSFEHVYIHMYTYMISIYTHMCVCVNWLIIVGRPTIEPDVGANQTCDYISVQQTPNKTSSGSVNGNGAFKCRPHVRLRLSTGFGECT